MIYTIVGHSAETRYHIIKDEDGRQYRVDILIDGNLSESEEYQSCKTYEEVISFEKSLVGKKVEIEDLTPYTYIGSKVKLV